MQNITITIVPKEVGELWDQILQYILNDVCTGPQHVPQLEMNQLIPHKYNERYNLYQGKCHQQYTSNLCGYHATFNILCFLNLFNQGQTHYDIQSSASFWSFKKRVQKFLLQIKTANKFKDQWPWTKKDILYGDFERTYNSICMDYFDDFDIFKNHNKFQLYSFTWQFQYQNLLIDQDKRNELNNVINYFKDYKGSKPVIINFMLAITNHWMCLIAIKKNNHSEYWFFDSNNRDILDLSEEEILQRVEQLNQERKKYKGSYFSEFFKKSIGVCMKDIQISLKLIIDCLQGKTTIDEYVYNQQFNVFANQLEKHWASDVVLFEHTIKQYWHNIYTFFKASVRLNLLSAHNILRLQRLVAVSAHIQNKSEQGKRLHALVKRYSNKTKV